MGLPTRLGLFHTSTGRGDLAPTNTQFERQSSLGHASWVNSVAFSPNGQTVASGGSYGIVYLWDVETGEQKDTLTGYSSYITNLSFRPDGQTLASGRGNGSISLWSIVPAPPEPERHIADINQDGVVNIQDLVLVAADFGQMGEYATDINGDGTVNIQDLVLVASAFNEGN